VIPDIYTFPDQFQAVFNPYLIAINLKSNAFTHRFVFHAGVLNKMIKNDHLIRSDHDESSLGETANFTNKNIACAIVIVKTAIAWNKCSTITVRLNRTARLNG